MKHRLISYNCMGLSGWGVSSTVPKLTIIVGPLSPPSAVCMADSEGEVPQWHTNRIPQSTHVLIICPSVLISHFTTRSVVSLRSECGGKFPYESNVTYLILIWKKDCFSRQIGIRSHVKTKPWFNREFPIFPLRDTLQKLQQTDILYRIQSIIERGVREG